MRGLKVLLLDKGDIGGGTSSWSTRLIHGGLRYLEHGELGLVRESLRERECLMNISPHLVRSLPILVPIYQDATRGPWTMRAGMLAYDMLSFDKTLPAHQMLTRDEALQNTPGLRAEGLLGAALYHDAQVEFAERLVLENVISAHEHGAQVFTYARVDKFITQDQTVIGVEFTKQPPGSSPIVGDASTQDRHSATASVVINAAGPWVDEVLEFDQGLAGSTQGSQPSIAGAKLIGGTKGSHIIVAPFPGASKTAIYVEAKTDQRPFFIIPWNGNYLIGTTDIRYDGDLEDVRINEEEIEYLLRETNRIIPAANLSRQKILYTYSGVRPLAFAKDRDEQRITRRAFVRQNPVARNLFSIVGGKLTTYRSLAEDTVDLIFRELGRSIPKCTTDKVVLPGAAALPLAANSGIGLRKLPEAANKRLHRIYGRRSRAILDLVMDDPSLGEVFDKETGAIAAEVVHAFKNEMAQTLSDCLLRRTMVGLNSTCGLDAVEAAAKVGQKHLGWSDRRAKEEIEAYRNYAARFRRVNQTG
jgi:glycerol-3-phosphate dehydrogenase